MQSNIKLTSGVEEGVETLEDVEMLEHTDPLRGLFPGRLRCSEENLLLRTGLRRTASGVTALVALLCIENKLYSGYILKLSNRK